MVNRQTLNIHISLVTLMRNVIYRNGLCSYQYVYGVAGCPLIVHGYNYKYCVAINLSTKIYLKYIGGGVS